MRTGLLKLSGVVLLLAFAAAPAAAEVVRIEVQSRGGSLAAGWLGLGIAGLAAAVALSYVVSGAALVLATHVSLDPAARRAQLERTA